MRASCCSAVLLLFEKWIFVHNDLCLFPYTQILSCLVADNLLKGR